MQVIKVPGINGLGKTAGCKDAGNAILAELRDIHSSESGKVVDVSKLEIEEIHVNNSDVEEASKLIYDNSFKIFQELGEKEKVVFLGGDHSVSYSLTRGFLDSCQAFIPVKEPCLIVFDAHPDLMPPMKEPTHEEWLRKLIEDGFPAENILLIGVRNSWKSEIDFIKEKAIRQINVDKFLEDLEVSCEVLMEFASGKDLYVSLDIDVVDPAFAPGTGYPVAGGLTARQMLYIIKRINKMKNLKAVDIVEINSEVDKKEFNEVTIRLGAKLLSELI